MDHSPPSLTAFFRANLSEAFDTEWNQNPELVQEFLTRLESLGKRTLVPKGEHPHRCHRPVETILLNFDGVFRYYRPEDGQTLGFGKPMSVVPPVAALKDRANLAFSVEALVESQVIELRASDLLPWIQKDLHWYRILWNILCREVSDLEALRLSFLADPAPLRYKKFLEEFGPIEQNIRVGDVASYLGMTISTLSRIRSKGPVRT